MGIKVAHNVKGSVLGDVAYASGKAQGSERRSQQDRSHQLSEEVNAIREKARQDANAKFFAQLQASSQARDEVMAFRKQQYEELPQRQQQLGDIENAQREDLTDMQYSRSQQQQLDKLTQARDYVQQNADGRYSPTEQNLLLKQIDEAEHGIKPLQKKQNPPWPKTQDSGQVWIDDNSGATLTRDDKGNVKVLVKPEKVNSFDNKLKVKEKIADYAATIFKSHEMSESPPDWQEAVNMAEEFFGDLIEEPNTASSPQGNETTMADTILKQVMSPETYAAAKATGLRSEDIYFMTQQLMAKKNASKDTSSDISKKQWLAKDENFNKYRQRFASGTPKSKIEDAYKNDPYIDENNSVLSDADHEVTTKYATWSELTDSMRDVAYKKYLKKNKMPIGDRFGMAVSKVISKSDHKNYKAKEKAHKAKLLTEEAFKKRCEHDAEFLWKFIKAPNRPASINIDLAQINSHRAIDSARKPVFGGL